MKFLVKNTGFISFVLIFCFVAFQFPLHTLAQAPNSGAGLGPSSGAGLGPSSGGGIGTNSGGGCGIQNGVFKLCNPLAVDNFCDLIKAILNVVLSLGVPIAVLFLVWAGFRFIFARGRPTELEAAKRNFMYVIIGIAIFLGAWTLASIISATIQQLDKSGNINICSRT